MAKQAIKPEPVERLPLNTKKRCSECGKTKELWEFNPTEANIGRRKAYCKECEAGLISPKIPPKIVGKGRPVFGLSKMGENMDKADEIKPIVPGTVGKIGKVKFRDKKGIKEIQEQREERRKELKQMKVKKKKTYQWRDKMKKKHDKIEKDSMVLLEKTITPHIKDHPFAEEHGFQAKDIYPDIKDNYPNNQYFTALLRRLVKNKKLKVKRQRGSPHIYFLITDGRIGKAPEKVVKKARIDFDKVTTIPLKKVQDMGKIEVNEEEEKEILKKVKGESKMKKSEKEGFDDDFLRGISTIADKVEIDFVERTTEIIISPSGNLLRVYDLLSKKQKENAVVDGKNLKFTW